MSFRRRRKVCLPATMASKGILFGLLVAGWVLASCSADVRTAARETAEGNEPRVDRETKSEPESRYSDGSLVLTIPTPSGDPISLGRLLDEPKGYVYADAPREARQFLSKLLRNFRSLVRVRADVVILDANNRPVGQLYLVRVDGSGGDYPKLRRHIYVRLAREFGILEAKDLGGQTVTIARTGHATALVWEPDALTFVLLLGTDTEGVARLFGAIADALPAP